MQTTTHFINKHKRHVWLPITRSQTPGFLSGLRFRLQGLVAGAVHLLLCVKAAEVQLLAVLPDVRLISPGPAWRRLRVCGLRSADLSTLYAGMPTAVPAVVRYAAVVRSGYV